MHKHTLFMVSLLPLGGARWEAHWRTRGVLCGLRIDLEFSGSTNDNGKETQDEEQNEYHRTTRDSRGSPRCADIDWAAIGVDRRLKCALLVRGGNVEQEQESHREEGAEELSLGKRTSSTLTTRETNRRRRRRSVAGGLLGSLWSESEASQSAAARRLCLLVEQLGSDMTNPSNPNFPSRRQSGGIVGVPAAVRGAVDEIVRASDVLLEAHFRQFPPVISVLDDASASPFLTHRGRKRPALSVGFAENLAAQLDEIGWGEASSGTHVVLSPDLDEVTLLVSAAAALTSYQNSEPTFGVSSVDVGDSKDVHMLDGSADGQLSEAQRKQRTMVLALACEQNDDDEATMCARVDDEVERTHGTFCAVRVRSHWLPQFAADAFIEDVWSCCTADAASRKCVRADAGNSKGYGLSLSDLPVRMTLGQVVKSLRRAVLLAEPLWKELQIIDRTCVVVDPPPDARYIATYRTIKLQDRLSAEVRIDWRSPRGLPDLHFMGPASDVKRVTGSFREALLAHSWLDTENVVVNLEATLGLTLPRVSRKTSDARYRVQDPLNSDVGTRPGDDGSDRASQGGALSQSFPASQGAFAAEDISCIICYSFNHPDDDSTPDILCGACAARYHGSCLSSWLLSVLTSRRAYGGVAGPCLTCSEDIHVALK